MGQEGLMFRCDGARMAFCGQVREHIVDLRDKRYIIVMSGKAENTTVKACDIPYHVGFA